MLFTSLGQGPQCNFLGESGVALGEFWEQSFKKDWLYPDQVTSLNNFDRSAGPVNQRICTGKDETAEKLFVTDKKFVDCELKTRIKGCTFTRCEFTGCRFTWNDWSKVKFSECIFTRCHFFGVFWHDCEFLDNCSFNEISASAEHFDLARTEIPASKFVQALTTNLRDLPEGLPATLQKQRFAVTKRKIAGAVLVSVRESADPINAAAAYREVVLAGIRAKIAEKASIYDKRERETVQRNRFFWFMRTLGDRGELLITWLSGWLTDWGQSLVRSVGYIVIVVIIFGCTYFWIDPALNTKSCFEHAASSFVKSAEISLVFGYTAHRPLDGNFAGTAIKFVNALLGLYWYSLVVGAMNRRTLL